MDAGRIVYNDATFRAMVLDLLQKTGRTLDDLKREFFNEVDVETTAVTECQIRTPEELAAFVQADRSFYDVKELAEEGRELALAERKEARRYALKQIAGHKYPGENLPRPRG